VLENARCLGAAVQELKGAVIRAVRESTDDVDRRIAKRIDVDIAARIEPAGRPAENCRVTNLSTGGCRLGGIVGMEIGSVGRVRIDGVVTPIGFEVAGVDATGIRVSFVLDTAQQAAVQGILGQVDRAAA
jgi:hypothetical protein